MIACGARSCYLASVLSGARSKVDHSLNFGWFEMCDERSKLLAPYGYFTRDEAYELFLIGDISTVDWGFERKPEKKVDHRFWVRLNQAPKRIR